MKRRTFAEKFSIAVASLSLAGCGDDEVTSPSKSPDTAPPGKDNFDRIREKFEEKMWAMVKLGVKDLNEELSFENEEECKKRYMTISDGSWYKAMLRNLKSGIENHGDPTDENHDDFHHYYLMFYRCCHRAGIQAARLTKGKKITTKDFEKAMLIVHKSMERLSRKGDVVPKLFACG